MSVDELREQLKVVFKRYVEYRQNSGRGMAISDRPKLNMRQCYLHSKMLLERWDQQSFAKPTNEYQKLIIDFVKAGDVYYHAKKHGIQSTLLYKLSRQ